MTAPRGISQPPTSFIGSQCQGIHHAPLNTYNTKPKVLNKTLKLHINTHRKPPPQKGGDHHACQMLATTIHKSNTTPHHQRWSDNTPYPRFPIQDEEIAGLLPQSPIVCLAIHHRCFPTGSTFVVHQTPTHYRPRPSNESPRSPNPHTRGRAIGLVVLLRKEVIQPHLPVRLPCYDFVPIASPTFDHSPPYGLGHGLRVLPTFMT